MAKPPQRIHLNGFYLLIAPDVGAGSGDIQMLSEHEFLVDNLVDFVIAHPEIDPHLITVYELHELNERNLGK